MSRKINKQKLRQIRYILKHDIFNKLNVATILIMILALVWLVSAVRVISLNHAQQRKLDAKLREVEVLKLQAQNLAYEQEYYKSQEYQDLAIRQKTNLALPGEKVLIMSDYSPWVEDKEKQLQQAESSVEEEKPSNFRQWMDFFFGAKATAVNE